MIRYLTFRLAVSLACLLIASCAAIQEQTIKEASIKEPAGWLAEQQKRQQIQVWEIRGRLGVQSKNNGGTMDIIWQQSEQDFTIRLIAPLGAGTYLIQGNHEFAEIRYPDGHKEIVDNIDDIFIATLDVNLPANVIKDWIRGLPTKSLPLERIEWNEQGLLNRVKQSGWNVEMTKYAGAEVLLPHALYASRDDDTELDIRLLLRQWMLDD